MYNTLAGLIEDNIIDVHRFLFQFNGDWRNWDEEFCLVSSSKKQRGDKEMIPLMFKKIQENKVGMLSTLPKGVKWEKLGYKYFDPATRDTFHKMFASTFPAAISEDAAKMIEQAYQ